MPWQSRLYKKLLFLYPEQFRRKYGQQLLQTFDDILANEPSKFNRIGLCVKEIFIMPINIVEQHLINISRRGGLQKKTVVSIVAFTLLVPFILSLMSDEIAESLYGQHLFNTWLWSAPVLITWVIILPLISLVISLLTYLISVFRTSKKNGALSLQLRRSWPIITTFSLSLGILLIVVFHDSAHCWLGNPINEVSHLSNTIRCTTRGLMGGDPR